MAYVDGFLLPLPKKNLAAYRILARQSARIWLEHGAIDYRECVGDDLEVPGMRQFPATLQVKKGETVVFAWITYKSRAHRDRVNKAVMQDPRMAKMMTRMAKKPPFDCTRMCYGGFQVMVSA